jgi:hypothetical protein
MAHRRFTDKNGRDWDVWTVIPAHAERRTVAAAGDSDPSDRREVKEYRAQLGPELSSGWLCFETKDEKRRLAPFPEHWELLPEAGLETLLNSAKVSPPTRRVP